METGVHRRWLWAALLFGIGYYLVGFSFGEIANTAASEQGRDMWRKAAFLVCVVMFAIHFGYEFFRLREPPRATALHVSVAVAVGAFVLAAGAIIHGLGNPESKQGLLALALVLWPVLTAVPAFLVALAVASLVARRGTRRRNQIIK